MAKEGTDLPWIFGSSCSYWATTGEDIGSGRDGPPLPALPAHREGITTDSFCQKQQYAVPFGGTRNFVDWRLLVKECIAKIAKPRTVFF